jgi:hypothetical protein
MNPKPSAPAAAELRSAVWRLRPILLRAVILGFLAGALSLSPSLYMPRCIPALSIAAV